jgi:hypothetical protein
VESVKGFAVEATDGAVGHVEWATYYPGESYLVIKIHRHLTRATMWFQPEPLQPSIRHSASST